MKSNNIKGVTFYCQFFRDGGVPKCQTQCTDCKPSPPSERVEDAAALQQQFKKETGKDTAGSWYEQWLENKLLEYRQSQPVQAGQWVKLKDKEPLLGSCVKVRYIGHNSQYINYNLAIRDNPMFDEWLEEPISKV